jgi:hypothetical protein
MTSGRPGGVRPAAVTRLPEGLPQQVAYFQFGLANAPTWILAVGGEKPLLYADLDRSGDLAKQAPVAGKADQSGTWFEPLTLTAEDGQQVRVRLMSHSGPNQQVLGCLHAFALGCRMGKVRLGDKTCGIALIDGLRGGSFHTDDYFLHAARQLGRPVVRGPEHRVPRLRGS